VAPFPKLPTLIPPPPAGPTFDPEGYQKLVADTLAPGQADLNGLQAQIDELKALTVLAGVDVPGWIIDFDEADLALSDFGDIEWGSPEPDLQPVTDYLTTQRDHITGTANALVPLKPIALILPNGSPGVVLGGPPSQGGPASAGGAPYVRHLPLVPVGPSVHNIDADGGTGPNPPIVSYGPVVQETQPDGRVWWVYLVHINPAKAGTFTGVAQYLMNLTITGITGTLTRTLPFQVFIQ
jgi:hypothetical protein